MRLFSTLKSNEDTIKFLLVGNPNTGKTTLFNSLTKSNEHVGNWHGVTVSEKEKVFYIEKSPAILSDLPGLYSLTTLSYEEEIASEYIFKNLNYPIINICDINNLKRNLFLTLQLAEITNKLILFINTFKNREKIKDEIINCEKILNKLGINYFIELNKKRFEYIENLFKNINKKNKKAYGNSKLDKILLNKYLALPIFFGILFLIFYLTFFSLGATLSNFLRDFIQNVVGGQITTWLRSVCSIAWIIDLVETGFIGGVGSILAFLPQVVLLFLFLSLIEDSGYLARIAFLFEDIFAKVGLSGKGVYALLMSFGCSTTAALTARNMEDKNAKIKTALLTPYMSCSAKLPIYAVIGGAFFGVSNIFIIFGLYIIGIIVALFLSLLLEQKLLKSKEQSFILEFPAYRIPSFKRVLKILWENLKLFLIRIGTIIFALNIIVWILQSFSFSFKFVPTSPGSISMLQHIGSLVAPIFIPLGFGNWGASAALIAGLAAKEIIVSSIAMFNGINVFGDSMKSQTMRSILDPTAVVFFTPAGALSFMIFCLLYSPCLPTISVFRKEIGKKWTFLSIVIQFAIAYSLSLILFNLYRLVEIWGGINVLLCFIAVFIIVISLIYVFDKIKNRKLCNYNCNKCNKCKK